MIEWLLFDIPAACMAEAAQRNAIPVEVLYAIRHHERGQLGFKHVHEFRDGRVSVDYGPFQINSHWASHFQRRYGLLPERLATEPCIAAAAAAYVLRYEVNRAGGDLWRAVGRYHSPTPARSEPYAARVSALALRYRQALATGQ